MTTFIAQITPSLQPNPSNLTNVLLLRILQQNTSFDGANPLAPVTNIPTSISTTQTVLFFSLALTLFVAFIAVLGKQWILYYTRATTWGNIVDRGKERQVKLVGLKKWKLQFIMESLPVMLQFALLLFGIALVVFLWDLEVSAAEVVLVVACIGLAFYAFIAVAAIVWKECPYQTPLSVFLPMLLTWAREFATFTRFRWRRLWRRWLRRLWRWLEPPSKEPQGWLEPPHRLPAQGWPKVFLVRVLGTFTGRNPAQDLSSNDRYMTLLNPDFWRPSPLFASPIQPDTTASAGIWLLENSTDFSAATAVAAVFSEFQWPSHQYSTAALIRLRDTYAECFRTPGFTKSTRLKALQSAAAYYVLYHTQLIWGASRGFRVEAFHSDLSGPLPPDLFLHDHKDEWDGVDVFKYLLHTDDRSELVTSARFLSYLAPYWFCGDSDSAIESRPSRWESLNELVQVLEGSQALISATLTDCVLCVGAAIDFPLHPEDLIRVDKRCVIQPID